MTENKIENNNKNKRIRTDFFLSPPHVNVTNNKELAARYGIFYRVYIELCGFCGCIYTHREIVFFLYIKKINKYNEKRDKGIKELSLLRKL